MQYRELFNRFGLSKGFYNVSIYNKHNKTIYCGTPLLSALHGCMDIDVINYRVENGSYSVKLNCEDAPIDYELANEVMSLALLDALFD